MKVRSQLLRDSDKNKNTILLCIQKQINCICSLGGYKKEKQPTRKNRPYGILVHLSN